MDTCVRKALGKFYQKDNKGPPSPLIFAKNSILRLGWTVDLSETGSWTYRKPVRGPIGNRFMDLSETGSWTYWEPVCGPNGNWFVDLTETGLWT